MLSQWPPLKLAKLGFAGLVLNESSLLAVALFLVPMRLRSVLLGLHESHLRNCIHHSESHRCLFPIADWFAALSSRNGSSIQDWIMSNGRSRKGIRFCAGLNRQD